MGESYAAQFAAQKVQCTALHLGTVTLELTELDTLEQLTNTVKLLFLASY